LRSDTRPSVGVAKWTCTMSRKSDFPRNKSERAHIKLRQMAKFLRLQRKAEKRAKFWALREAASKDPAARAAFDAYRMGVMS
jgi:phosphopantetheinyl transferase (holo-ACP synthase)